MLSISTSGKSPATSRRIREYFETLLNADSLYTLGYEAGKPVPIESQGLPYPVYLLLENRKCVVLCEEKTEKIERRVSLLRQCGASVLCPAPNTVKPHYLDDAFLVIAEKTSMAAAPCESEDRFIQEYLDETSAGTHFTPHLVRDDNLIISVAARRGTGAEKAEHLRKKLANQFENNGYGAFIEFLGAHRSEILKSFPTPKKRADFFETLIDTVEVDNLQPQTCCLDLTNLGCSAECLFNWVRGGRLKHANNFVSDLLKKLSVNSN